MNKRGKVRAEFHLILADQLGVIVDATNRPAFIDMWLEAFTRHPEFFRMLKAILAVHTKFMDSEEYHDLLAEYEKEGKN